MRYLSVYEFLSQTEPATLEFALNPLEVIDHFEQKAYKEWPDTYFRRAPAEMEGVYPNNWMPCFPVHVLDKVMPVSPT